MARISYETEGFPSGSVPNGIAELPVTWDEVLWAAVTVGRPNRQFVFQYGDASRYEALFRWSLTRMALEQSGPGAYRLRRTSAAKTLDPTEKGAVNYFIGMTFCKLFASKLLDTPWLLHLDVFRPAINAILAGRSRPDLVGRDGSGRWHAFECKGRISQPDRSAKLKAKTQANRLVSVGGMACTLHVGALTYLSNDILQFYWVDPPPEEGPAIEVGFSADAWRFYYSPILDAMRQESPDSISGGQPLVPVAGLDLQLGLHPAVTRPLALENWEGARSAALEARREIADDGYQPDGLLVKAGDSWSSRYSEPLVN